MLKKTRARKPHVCDGCGGTIAAGETYYRDCEPDRFLSSLHAKKYCLKCYAAIEKAG